MGGAIEERERGGMEEVGIRELRNHLSRYLEHVRAGNDLVVTDRGRPVARVVPIRGERTLDRLIRDGKVTPARTRGGTLPSTIDAAGPVSDLVAHQRH